MGGALKLRWFWIGAVATLIAGALILGGIAGYDALTNDPAKCTPGDEGGPLPSTTMKRYDLQSAARPALNVEVGDKAQGIDDIVFPVKSGRNLDRGEDRASAQVTVHPRKDGERLDADVVLQAEPIAVTNRVRLTACIDSKGTFTAGTYTGTATVWGPQVKEFSYPVTVTEKWPKEVAIGLLAALSIGIAAGLWASPLPPGNAGQKRRSATYAIVAIGAVGLVYWGVYEANDTWGENPASDVTALITGALASALAAVGIARQKLTLFESPPPAVPPKG